jgi:exonuclease III
MHLLKKLKIMSWNSQTLKPKIPELLFYSILVVGWFKGLRYPCPVTSTLVVPELSQFVNKHNVDIILIQEIWLSSTTNILLSGYKVYRADRTTAFKHPHGGVAIFVKNNLVHSQIKSHQLKCVENLFIQIPFGNSYLRIGSIYATPSIPIDDFRSDF